MRGGGSAPSSPPRQASPPPPRYSSPPAGRQASPPPSYGAGAGRQASGGDSANDIEDLAAVISKKFMGMGKTAMDALPELKRQVRLFCNSILDLTKALRLGCWLLKVQE